MNSCYFVFCCRCDESDGERLVWQLLALVAEDSRVDLQRYLRRALDQWSRSGHLTSSLVSDICSHVQDKDHMKVSRTRAYSGTSE